VSGSESRAARSGRQESLGGEIALTGIVVEAEHPRALGQLLQLAGDRRKRGPRRDADQYSLLAGAVPRELLGVVRLDRDRTVEQADLQYPGNAARADSLDRMRRMLAATDHLRRGRLHGEHLQLRPGLLQHPGATGDVAAGADAGDQAVQPFGEVTQYLARGRTGVHVHVGWVL